MTAGAKMRAPRVPLDARALPDYSRGEEIFNMVSHIVGSAFAVGLLVFCVLRAAFHHNGWGVCLIGTVFTAIDLHKFGPLSYACYFIAGWSALISLYAIGKTYGILFVLFLLAGGIAYTSGMVFFVRQTKGYRYSHSVFHLFILAGSVLHAVPVILWCM